MTSLKMLKHFAVTLRNCWGLEVPYWIIFKAQLQIISNFKPNFWKEHGPLYQFDFRNRWVGAYRSMGTKKDEYGITHVEGEYKMIVLLMLTNGHPF